MLCMCYGSGRAYVYLVFWSTVWSSAEGVEKARMTTCVVGGVCWVGGGNQATWWHKRVVGNARLRGNSSGPWQRPGEPLAAARARARTRARPPGGRAEKGAQGLPLIVSVGPIEEVTPVLI